MTSAFRAAQEVLDRSFILLSYLVHSLGRFRVLYGWGEQTAGHFVHQLPEQFRKGNTPPHRFLTQSCALIIREIAQIHGGKPVMWDSFVCCHGLNIREILHTSINFLHK